ncbi:hypothetical protein PENSPDRAFT_688076 [Peniophora sp. CONT]|nr:hypothetical protein PENSPDRAFT_688076 [Peniophora sp. CONT]
MSSERSPSATSRQPSSTPASPIPRTALSTSALPVLLLLASMCTSTRPAAVVTLPPMPRHWRNNYSDNVRPKFLRPILRATFLAFCLIAYGQPNLETQWRIMHNSRSFEEEKDRLTKNVGTVNIVATLLLATTATFITTVPPQAGIIDYNRRGPYICLLASFGLLLFGIIVGSAAQFFISSCTQDLVRDTLMSTRFRIWVIMSSLVYPFVAIGAAASANILGLLITAWASQDRIVQVGSGFLLALPLLLLVLFLLIISDFDSTTNSDGA